MRYCCFALLLFICSGCGMSALDHDKDNVFEDPTAYEKLEAVAHTIRTLDIEGFVELAHKDMREEGEARKQLEKLFTDLEALGDFELIHYYSERRVGQGEFTGIPIYLNAYDLIHDGGFMQTLIAVAAHDDKCCVITHFSYKPTSLQISTVGNLSLDGKGWFHYLIAALAILIPIFMIATAIACGMNRKIRRKWLWIPLILIGFWGIDFNWATGAMSNNFIYTAPNGTTFISFIQLQLLGVGIQTIGPFQPWIISIGSPLAALTYWLIPRFRRGPNKSKETLDTF